MVAVAATAAICAAALAIRDRLNPMTQAARALRSADPDGRRAAALDLLAAGPADARAALVALIAAADDDDPLLRWNVIGALGRVAAVAARDPDDRPEVAAAVGVMARALDDPVERIRGDAVRALAEILPLAAADPAAGTAALARAALDDRSGRIRAEATTALFAVATRSPLPPPAELARAVRGADRPGAIRGAAAVLLAAFPAGRPAAPATLVEALGDPDPRARRGAAAGLALLDPTLLRPAVAPLLRALEEPVAGPAGDPAAGPAIRWSATGPPVQFADPAVPGGPPPDRAAAAAARDPAPLAAVALRVAAAADPPDDRIVDGLARMLAAPSPWRRDAAAAALNALGPRAARAGPALAGALARVARERPWPSWNGPSIIGDLAGALAQVAPGTPLAPEAVALLIGALDDPSWYTTTAVATALSRFGPAAAPALPRLRALAGRGDWSGDLARAILVIESSRPVPDPPRSGAAPPAGGAG